MSEIVWSLKGTDTRCDSYGPGHLVHWIQYKHSVREPGPVIPVTASLDDDGVILLERNDLLLMGWNHRPELVAAGLLASRGAAVWQPRWRLLLVPPGDRVDGASNAFYFAALDQRRPCIVARTTNPDHLVPRAPAPTKVPPLRVAPRYATGMVRIRDQQKGEEPPAE